MSWMDFNCTMTYLRIQKSQPFLLLQMSGGFLGRKESFKVSKPIAYSACYHVSSSISNRSSAF